MKKLLQLLLCFIAFNVNAQIQRVTGDSIIIGLRPASKINLDGNITAKSFNGKRPITGTIATGQNPNTNDLVAWLNAVFYPSQVPTAGLTGVNTTRELEASGSFSTTLNWSAGRQSATEPLATVVVDGVSKGFSQPSPGTNVTGSHSVSLTANVNRTITNVVTTTDGKSASASVTFTFLPKRYWGRTTSAAATASDLLASTGGNSELSSSKAVTFTVTASGSNRVFFAYPSNLGDLTSINIGGLESIGAFTKTVLSFTNASGFTQNYNVYTSINETGGNVTAITN